MVRIALIGDDPAFIRVTGQVLDERGWESVSCGPERDAYEFVMAERPETIVLHIGADESEDAWKMLRRLEEGRHTHAIPVIICSADWDEVHALQEFLNRRDIAVLYKPFELDALEEMIETALLKAERRSQQLRLRRSKRTEGGTGA